MLLSVKKYIKGIVVEVWRLVVRIWLAFLMDFIEFEDSFKIGLVNQ